MERNLTKTEQTILSAYMKFLDLYEKEDFVIDRSGQRVLELINYSMLLDPFETNVDLSNQVGRKTPLGYVRREIEWYESQSLNVNDIPGKIPEIWKQISSDKGEINSNYGHLIYSEENYEQYKKCIEMLKSNKFSRRAIMVYIRPSIQEDYNRDGMLDFICTTTNQFFIRNNKLISIYQMRSNDFTFGFYNDFPWAGYVYRNVFAELKKVYPELEVGELHWNTNSLHIYERHFKYLDILKNNLEFRRDCF